MLHPRRPFISSGHASESQPFLPFSSCGRYLSTPFGISNQPLYKASQHHLSFTSAQSLSLPVCDFDPISSGSPSTPSFFPFILPPARLLHLLSGNPIPHIFSFLASVILVLRPPLNISSNTMDLSTYDPVPSETSRPSKHSRKGKEKESVEKTSCTSKSSSNSHLTWALLHPMLVRRGVSADFNFVLPKDGQTAENPPPGCLTWYYHQFEGGLTLPVPSFMPSSEFP